jgi:hypothetical protein
MKKKIFLLIFSIFLTCVCFVSASCSKKNEGKKSGVNQDKVVENEDVEKPVYCPLCGSELSKSTDLKRPIAVMIENLATIRPQRGLDSPCMVVEGLSEGGITRFMAVYVHQDVGEIGPVRSARTHFVAVGRGIDAIYAHCGGSKPAMEAIKQWDVMDLDQFFRHKAYWRTKGNAPHNLWTSTSKIRGESKDNEYPEDLSQEGFNFKEDVPFKKRPKEQNITIKFSSAAYNVDYKYKKESNTYLRFNGGQAHTDRISGKQIEVKNIIVIFATTNTIFGGPLLDVKVVGSGKCIIFRDGAAVEGTWEKPSVESNFSFLDKKNNEISLNRGQTWIEIVKTNTLVIY